MTKIIKKKKRLTDEEVQTKKKVEGKNLQQSGDFFNRYKVWLTWLLVGCFLLTCFGITGVLFKGCMDDRNQPTVSQNSPVSPDGETQRDPESEMQFLQSEAQKNPNDEMRKGNLAFAYQQKGLELLYKDRFENSNKSAAQIELNLNQALKYYNEALAINPNYGFAVMNLMNIMLEKKQYSEVIAMGEKYVAEKDLTNKTLVEFSDKDIESNKDSVEDFYPVLAKLAIAYDLTGDTEKFAKIADKALELNPQDLELIYAVVGYKLNSKDEKIKESGVKLLQGAAILVQSDIDSMAGKTRVDVRHIVTGAKIYELLADYNVVSGNKNQAVTYFAAAERIYSAFGDQEDLSKLNEKMKALGIEAPTAPANVNGSASYREDANYVYVKRPDGTEMKISKEKLEQYRKQATKTETDNVPTTTVTPQATTQPESSPVETTPSEVPQN